MVGQSFDRPCRGPRGFVLASGEHIYFESYGQGDAVVFTHGLGGNHAVWYQQITEFAKYFRVITWDQRGFGRSSNKGDKAGPDTSVDDLTTILDGLEIKRAHIIGQSMGGWSTLGFALRNPERTESMVLGDSTGGIFTQNIERVFDEYARKAASPAASTALPMGGHPALAERFRQENFDQAFLYEQIGEIGGDPPDSVWSVCRKTAYPHEKLKGLGIPALFIAGSDDPIFGPAIVREAASVLSGSEVVIIPDAGHSPYFEVPQLWNGAVLKFLRDAATRW